MKTKGDSLLIPSSVCWSPTDDLHSRLLTLFVNFFEHRALIQMGVCLLNLYKYVIYQYFKYHEALISNHLDVKLNGTF